MTDLLLNSERLHLPRPAPVEVRCARCVKLLVPGEGSLCAECRQYVSRPTRFVPGTEEKIVLMTYRAMEHQPLYVKGDLTGDEACRADYEARPFLGTFGEDSDDDTDW